MGNNSDQISTDSKYESKLDERLFKFAVDVIRYVQALKLPSELVAQGRQLINSASSFGANYEEAQGAASKKDFLNKTRICLKEIREANYWLRIFRELFKNSQEASNSLIKESEELKKIFGSITSKIGKELGK